MRLRETGHAFKHAPLLCVPLRVSCAFLVVSYPFECYYNRRSLRALWCKCHKLVQVQCRVWARFLLNTDYNDFSVHTETRLLGYLKVI